MTTYPLLDLYDSDILAAEKVIDQRRKSAGATPEEEPST